MTRPPDDKNSGGLVEITHEMAEKIGPKKPGKPKVVAGTQVQRDPDFIDEELPIRYGENSSAQRFARKHAHELRFVNTWGKWMHWDGRRWVHESTILAFDLIREVCDEIAHEAERDQSLTPYQQTKIAITYSSARTVASVEKFARAARAHASLSGEWDQDKWAINTPGGIVNLKTGQTSPCDQAARMTKITGVSPAPRADCPTWIKFLERVTGGDEDLQEFLKRIAGYSLTGSIKEHALFFLYGTGRNGKGTFLGMLQHILGDYAQVAGMDVFIEQQGSRHPTELASLMGARLVAAQETEQGKRWAEARIKQMTGGDPVRARFMRMDEFTFLPQFKLIIAGNHKPRLRNVDEAIKARMNLIPFTVTIPPQERDKDLAEKLEAEAPAVFRWMIDGCMEWQEMGLKPPKCVTDATEKYLSEQDSLAEWIEQECVVNQRSRGLSKELYKAYAAFTEASGEYVMSVTAWKEKLASRNMECGKYAGNIVIQGLDLKNKLI